MKYDKMKKDKNNYKLSPTLKKIDDWESIWSKTEFSLVAIIKDSAFRNC